MDKECCQHTCKKIATHTVFWPGTDGKKMCKTCARYSQEVAQAMGLFVAMREIEDDS